MNDFITKMLNRTSVREFDNSKQLSTQQRQVLVDSVNKAATSINGQYFGCVFLEDKKIIEQFGESGRFQSHIKDSVLFAIFFTENNQLNHMSQKTQTLIGANHEDLLTTSIVDVTIAATQLQDAAVSMGLGTCWIGAVRSYPQLIMDALKLPENNVPIVGLVIGFPKEGMQIDLKPKMNKVYFNEYDAEVANEELDQYDEIIAKYYLERSSNQKTQKFSEMVTHFYKNDKWDREWCDLIKKAYPKLGK